MKATCFLLISLVTLLWSASPAMPGAVNLRYGFAPGQQWECTRMSRMTFMVMGQKQTQQQRHTLLYTVSKGPKKNWVRLTARYINPPTKTEENKYALGQYDFTFTAEVHSSGDIRNVAVTGVDTVMQDASLGPQEKSALLQSNKIMAESLKPSVFWFPELPEEALQPGDEFEDKRSHGFKDPNMASSTQTRKVFVLEDISAGLAYFSTKERHATKMSTMGGAMDGSSTGKGEIIFDLKEGMWIELTTQSKMKFSGAMMGGGEGQEMLMTEKVVLQRR